MQRQKRRDDDRGSGGGGSGSSSSSSTTTHSPQTSVTTITTTSIKTTTPTTITTLVTSINVPGNPPNTGQSGPGPTTGGGRITSPQSLPPSQSIPSGSSSSNPSTATVSSSSAPSTPQPVFRFNDLANATLCSPFGLSWTYSGQTSVAMTLTIQQSISQPISTTTTSSSLPLGSPATMRILTTNALSNADNFIWTSVDVMEGWYIAKAFDTSATLGISAGSTPFFVVQGSDTSCLLKVPTSTSNPPPSQSTSSGTSASPKPSIGTGDIVGITLGVTAGAICLLLALFTIPRLKPRNDPSVITEPPSTKPRRPYLLY